MADTGFPSNLARLHIGEEAIRGKAVQLVLNSRALTLHFAVVEVVMDMEDTFRQLPADDEDLKTVQLLSLRIFNSTASSVSLALSGYSQGSAMLLRDVLETVFLIDLFRTDPDALTKWRTSSAASRRREFAPAAVRKALDSRDGFTGQRREAAYRLFSELAGHASVEGFSMLRPNGMDAHNGPFLDPATLDAVVAEMGRLCIQVGEVLAEFIPPNWKPAYAVRLRYAELKAEWLNRFYPDALKGNF